jgi:hypothetical protein
MGVYMKDTAKQEGVKGEPYDYSKDFKVLTLKEKRGVLKAAKNLLKLQKDNALLADAPCPPPMEGERQERV